MGYINPLLQLPAAREIVALPASPEKELLIKLLRQMRQQADVLAEQAWTKRKAPMAAYWRATATYSRHTAHVFARKGLL